MVGVGGGWGGEEGDSVGWEKGRWRVGVVGCGREGRRGG